MPRKSKKVVKDYGKTVSDMPLEMQDFALETAKKALAECKTENDAVAQVKDTFDRKFGPTWHAVLGKNFGSQVTHESRTFLYITVNKQLKMLLFKS